MSSTTSGKTMGRAYGKVTHARKKGLLPRKPCVVCGDKKSEGHHPDYNKPLDVVWLCQLHHAEMHKELRNARRAGREPAEPIYSVPLPHQDLILRCPRSECQNSWNYKGTNPFI